jgi:hypothetical protein
LNVSGGLEYLGNRSMQIKEVDSPLVSKWPVRPHLLLHGIVGIFFGVLAGGIYVILRDKQRGNVSTKHHVEHTKMDGNSLLQKSTDHSIHTMHDVLTSDVIDKSV